MDILTPNSYQRELIIYSSLVSLPNSSKYLDRNLKNVSKIKVK